MKKILWLLVFSIYLPKLCGLTLNNVSSQTQGQTQVIKLQFDMLVSSPKLFINGNDLIIDFYQAQSALTQKQYIFKDGLIHEINITSVNNRIRFIIVGGSKYSYQLVSNGNKLNIIFSNQFGRSTLTKTNVGLIGLGSSSTNDSALQIIDIKFRRDDNGGGIVEVLYNGNTSLNLTKERLGNGLKIKINAVNFKTDLLKRLDVTDFDTPIKYIDTISANNSLLISIVNRNNWDYAVYELQNKLIINIRRLNKEINSEIPDLNPDIAKSDRVSFNFQNIEVRALMQLLADFSGYNVIVSDSVTGTISLKLNNVPWTQALKTILSAKGLGMKREDNIIRVAPIAEIAALNKQQEINNQAQEAVEPLETLTARLKYAQAANVQSMIQKPFAANVSVSASPSGTVTNNISQRSLLSSRGTILIDNRTNMIIINDTPSRLKDIKELIDKIDIPVKQVLIEARIVEANSNFEKDLGTRLLLAGVNGSVTVANTLENGVTINQQGINAISTNSTTGGSIAPLTNVNSSFVNQNFRVAGPSLSTIFAPNSDTLIGLEIDALELQSQGRTISNPKIMTANYQMANIQQGVQIPYQQASSAGNTNIAFVNATLSLQATPQITDDGYILLNVSIQKDSPSIKLQVQGTPAIDINSVTTQVRVKDGSTILVGGIYIDDQQIVEEKVPVLGDIPYLGWLFKSQSTKMAKKELLVFITPRVIVNSLDDD